jgi:hypothetical protein
MRLLARRPVLWSTLAVVLVASAVVAVWAFAHGPMEQPALVRSIERVSGSAAGRMSVGSSGCLRDPVGGWQCEVVDSAASGTASYHVWRTGGSCWKARLTRPAFEPMPKEISGCVLLRD